MFKFFKRKKKDVNIEKKSNALKYIEYAKNLEEEKIIKLMQIIEKELLQQGFQELIYREIWLRDQINRATNEKSRQSRNNLLVLLLIAFIPSMISIDNIFGNIVFGMFIAFTFFAFDKIFSHDDVRKRVIQYFKLELMIVEKIKDDRKSEQVELAD